MANVRFYDLLGVTSDEEAASMWPRSRIQSVVGVGSDDPIELVRYLQATLEFRNITPGTYIDQITTPRSPVLTVGISAELIVKKVTDLSLVRPLVLTQMPDIAFYLIETPNDKPARIFVTHKQTGTELVAEGIPVEIRIPSDLLGPLRTVEEENANPSGGPDVTFTENFQPGVYDSLQIILRDNDSSSIKVHLRIRMTEEMDFILEPAVPISIGPCRFTGLPCKGLHDLSFIPSPRLPDNHSEGEQALEWTRHRIDRFTLDSGYSGIITVRTVDLDNSRAPIKELYEKMNQGRSSESRVEFVLEDLALPLANISGLPIPSHGTFGLRRKIEMGDNLDEAFGLSGSPVQIKLSDDWNLLIDHLLLLTPARLDPPDQFIFLKMALLFGSPSVFGSTHPAATLTITDEWTVQVGCHLPENLDAIATIADCTIKLVEFKIGWSLKRYRSKNPATHKPYDWKEQVQLLADLSLHTKGTTISDTAFRMRSLSGKDIDVIIRDLGWNLGSLSLGGLSFPEGVQLIFADRIRLIVEEAGWVAENNGARYFFFSGGVSLLPGLLSKRQRIYPSAAVKDEEGGIRFRRLRFRTGGNPDAPKMLIDGISLSLRFGKFELTGFGTISEFNEAGHDFKEYAFGIQVKFHALKKDFLIGMQLVYGRVKGPIDNFTYWMFGFQFSPIPIGSFKLIDIRMLLAGNMAPDLPPPDGQEQSMRLFRWYKSGVDMTMPTNRKLGGWIRKDDSFAAALGSGLRLSCSDKVTLDLFLLLHKSPDEFGMLIALEVYLHKDPDDPKPIGYGAFEYDFEQDKLSFMIGVNFGIKEAVGELNIPDIAKVTGTLYVANKPDTFAIGQLADQTTWLSLRIGISDFMDLSLQLGICMQIVDRPEGPRGFGLIASLKGGAKFGVGKLQIYATLGLIAGVWQNESKVRGFVGWLEAGLRIKVFGVFNFGASIKIEFDYLGPNPTYKRFGFQVRIETPWWLPDVTFRFEKIWSEPKPEELVVISAPLITSGAISPGVNTQENLAVTPLIGTSINEHELYTMSQLRAMEEPTIEPNVLESLSFITIDSTIALNFKPPIDDNLSVGENTPAGAGTQQSTPPAVNDLKSTYELIEFGIRRRPHFGANAGIWTTLLAPEDTRLQSPQDFPTGTELDVHFLSSVSFQWDKDLIRDDRLDPRRLLINASTPYTFLTSDSEADESIVRNDPAWPCCREVPENGHGCHELEFTKMPIGRRVPSCQTFTDSKSTLHWLGSRSPVVADSTAIQNGPPVARLMSMNFVNGPILTINFDEPAFIFEMYCYWRPIRRPGSVAVEAYKGLNLVSQKILQLAPGNPIMPLHIESREGITSALVRLEVRPDIEDREDWIEFARMRYCTLREEFDKIARAQKCKAQEKRAVDGGGGKLAWLPNHDYEISLTTKVILDHTKAGSQEGQVKQKAFFRTKGLPGLNAVNRIGDELEKYVESRYPNQSPRTLYRSEPVALVFNENFNILLPVDRSSSTDNPAELNQILEWVLNIDKMGASSAGQRISQPSPDWIVIHRTEVLIPPPYGPLVTDAAVVQAIARTAHTTDPSQVRLQNMFHRSDECNGSSVTSLRRSQVLLHRPVNPLNASSEPEAWEPSTLYRVNLRNKNGPFIDRTPFHESDWTAFDFSDEGQSLGTSWVLTDGMLRVSGSPRDGIRRYAIFGENDWNHIQIHTTVDPQGGTAGVAVGLQSLSPFARGLLVLVNEGIGRLQILEVSDSTTTREIANSPLSHDSIAPFALEVIAFDDRLRARVGDSIVEVPQQITAKREVREGRLALVAQDGGSFSNLIVEPLDAYRFEFQSSRFKDFEEHIASFNGEAAPLPLGNAVGPNTAIESVSSLLANTLAEILSVMAFGFDREIRQRLFERWVNGLSLLLRDQPKDLSLSRVTGTLGTELLILESPEPLPFSEDVKLKLEKRKLIGPLSPLSPNPDEELIELATVLDFGSDKVTGFIKKGRVSQVLIGGHRHLVRTEKVGNDMKYYIYRLVLFPNYAGSYRLFGKVITIVQSVSQNPSTDPMVAQLTGILEDQIAFTDDQGNLLFPNFMPMYQIEYEEIPIRILTNGNETHSLIVPTDPVTNTSTLLMPGLYRFDFSVDRARFRSQTPDSTTNYRANASFVTLI